MKENLRLMIVGAVITGIAFYILSILNDTSNIGQTLAIWSTGLVILIFVSTFDLASFGKEGDNIEDAPRGSVLLYGAVAPISGPIMFILYAYLYLRRNWPNKKIREVISYLKDAPE